MKDGGFIISRLVFFDDDVIRDIDEKGGRVLSRFGAYVMRGARRAIRNRSRSSKPGQSPTNWTGTLRGISGREPGIFFFYDRIEQSVVIGPTFANQVFFGRNREPVRGTVPEVLEEGGEIRILEAKYGDKWYRADLRSKRRLSELPTRLRTVRIAARPYMQPVFDKSLPKLREWKRAAA